ncbi:hypothetical protein CLOHYLEM_06961 [[Clostridium] hylemonae DSM 15053]|uniref:Uncharacterized protein n=1 Tax=[Clostridium] hylemonae DSM 15053 TaxID=553973 RepID=C0C4E5_9FIRM|nr:hypothetical protein CLOHYLEM_06961 [[Clostridium] hylemonae DSM 15053]
MVKAFRRYLHISCLFAVRRAGKLNCPSVFNYTDIFRPGRRRSVACRRL